MVASGSDSQAEVEAGVVWLNRNRFDILAELGRALEHRAAPLADTKVSSWVEKTDDGPGDALEGHFDIGFKLADLDDNVAGCFNPPILVLLVKVESNGFWVVHVGRNSIHLYEVRLRVGQDSTCAL